MRRAKLEGRRIGRAPLNVERIAIVRDRLAGLSLTEAAKKHRVSRATVVRLVRDAKQPEMVAAAWHLRRSAEPTSASGYWNEPYRRLPGALSARVIHFLGSSFRRFRAGERDTALRVTNL